MYDGRSAGTKHTTTVHIRLQAHLVRLMVIILLLLSFLYSWTTYEVFPNMTMCVVQAVYHHQASTTPLKM